MSRNGDDASGWVGVTRRTGPLVLSADLAPGTVAFVDGGCGETAWARAHPLPDGPGESTVDERAAGELVATAAAVAARVRATATGPIRAAVVGDGALAALVRMLLAATEEVVVDTGAAGLGTTTGGPRAQHGQLDPGVGEGPGGNRHGVEHAPWGQARPDAGEASLDHGQRWDVVIDTTGSADRLRDALGAVRHLGTLLLASRPGTRAGLARTYADLHVRGITVTGVYWVAQQPQAGTDALVTWSLGQLASASSGEPTMPAPWHRLRPACGVPRQSFSASPTLSG